MPHLIRIADLNKNQIETLIKHANQFLNQTQHEKNLRDVVALLFFEASTRTRISFELAAKQLGHEVIHYDPEKSSMQKGESLKDTVENLASMGIKNFVIRHQNENIFTDLLPIPNIHIINAGNGIQEHPTQSLIDMMTISQFHPDFSKLKIAIIGDIKHSRVAHSNILALQKLGAKEIRLIAPEQMNEKISGTQQFFSLDEGIADADVIILLRIQKERLEKDFSLDIKKYIHDFSLTANHLKHAKKNCLIMHPGPVNWGIEINYDLMSHPNNMILQQVKNSVAMRMAVFCFTKN